MEAGTWEGATALVVIDVQQGFDAVSAPRNHPDCERNVAALIEAWRRQGWPVVFVRHDSEEERSPLRPDLPGNALKPEVSGEPDLLVVKSVHSAFYGAPSLHGWAREQGIAGLAICGLQTNVCCETTARMASDLGYDTLFVIDATATFDQRAPDGGVITADELTRVTASTLDPEFCKVVTTADLVG